VAAHSIGNRNEQPPIFNIENSLSGALLSLTAIQGKNQVIVLIIAPPLTHVGMVGNSSGKPENTLLFAAEGR
jgi:hypothetical protein